jgi:hypothetical protein
MTTIYYDPTSEFDVPAGTYTVRFEGLVDKPPFENSRYAREGEEPEPRWGWQFRVLGGEHDGKLIEQDTGRKTTRRAKVTQLLSWLMGGNLQPKTTVRVSDLVGRTYTLILAPNPNSEKGNNHIAHLEPVAADGNGAATAQAPPPPPPPLKKPPASASAGGGRFWVVIDGQTVEKTRDAIEEWLREDQLDPAEVQVCPVGKGTTWGAANEHGFVDPRAF